jgi:hypothetical protein
LTPTVKVRGPTPAVDEFEAAAAKFAEAWPARGHRKIAALMRADRQVVSTSTAEWALRRRGLLLPRGLSSPPQVLGRYPSPRLS